MDGKMTRQKEQETLQKNKRADRNGKSNDCPEIPEEDIGHLWPPFRVN